MGKKIRRTRKTRKTRRVKKTSRITKYTAFIPKTVKATKSVSTKIIKSGYSIFNTAKNSVKKFSKNIDKHAAKAIRSLTKRR